MMWIGNLGVLWEGGWVDDDDDDDWIDFRKKEGRGERV